MGILDVVYNASNNELVRTKTLGKKSKVKDDKKKEKDGGEKKAEQDDVKKSRDVLAKLKHRAAKQKLDPLLEDQFQSGRLMACIASRPGQSGRCDGYILEGEEIVFYKKKLEKKKSK